MTSDRFTNFYNSLFEDKSTEEIQVFFAIPIGIFGAIAFSVYATINIFIKDYYIAIFEYVLALIVVVITFLTVRSKSIRFAISYGIIPIMAISIHNFATGGYDETGILWSYVFPPVVVFFSGKKSGTYLSLLFLFITFVYYLLGKAGMFSFLYDDFYYIMFLITFLAELFMIIIIQTAWDTSRKVVEEQKRNAELARKKISKEMQNVLLAEQQAKEAVKKMKEANIRLEKANKVMVDRELKMIELKRKLDLKEGTG